MGNYGNWVKFVGHIACLMFPKKKKKPCVFSWVSERCSAVAVMQHVRAFTSTPKLSITTKLSKLRHVFIMSMAKLTSAYYPIVAYVSLLYVTMDCEWNKANKRNVKLMDSQGAHALLLQVSRKFELVTRLYCIKVISCLLGYQHAPAVSLLEAVVIT